MKTSKSREREEIEAELNRPTNKEKVHKTNESKKDKKSMFYTLGKEIYQKEIKEYIGRKVYTHTQLNVYASFLNHILLCALKRATCRFKSRFIFLRRNKYMIFLVHYQETS